MRPRRVWSIVLAGSAYVVIGTVTALSAAVASSLGAVKAWRLVAWVLSLVVFGIHFLVERRRPSSRLRVAATVALGVALGAFGVAAVGPFRAHWAEPARLKLAMLSLVAWPVITGVPAFVVAWLGGVVLDRAKGVGQAVGPAVPDDGGR